MRFSYNNIRFKKHGQEDYIVVTGEITNESGRKYNAVVFRIISFIKNIPVGNITITIRGFYIGQTKTFEARMGELDYKIISQISRYEIYPESAY